MLRAVYPVGFQRVSTGTAGRCQREEGTRLLLVTVEGKGSQVKFEQAGILAEA